MSCRGSRRDGHAVLRSGRSAPILCTFALVCALIARYVVVPPLPSTVPPPTPLIDVFLPPPAPATPAK